MGPQAASEALAYRPDMLLYRLFLVPSALSPFDASVSPEDNSAGLPYPCWALGEAEAQDAGMGVGAGYMPGVTCTACKT